MKCLKQKTVVDVKKKKSFLSFFLGLGQKMVMTTIVRNVKTYLTKSLIAGTKKNDLKKQESGQWLIGTKLALLLKNIENFMEIGLNYWLGKDLFQNMAFLWKNTKSCLFYKRIGVPYVNQNQKVRNLLSTMTTNVVKGKHHVANVLGDFFATSAINSLGILMTLLKNYKKRLNILTVNYIIKT